MVMHRFKPKNTEKEFSLTGSGMFDDLKVDSRLIAAYSGFNFLDMPTATTGYDSEWQFIMPNGGLIPRPVTTIGESGCGKSTLVLQWAGGVVDNYWGANMFIADAEGHTSIERIAAVNNWSEQRTMERCTYMGPSPFITANDIYNKVRGIVKAKKDAGVKIKIPTPYADRFTGKTVEVYPPTIFIVDSVPALQLPKTEEDSVDSKREFKNVEAITSNTSGLNDGKVNTEFIKKVKPFCDEGNICIILINHTVKEIQMSMFDRPKIYHQGLPAGVKIKGGTEQIYQTALLPYIKTTGGITDRDNTYGDEVRGHTCSIQYVKVKTNVGNTVHSYVFDNATGVRPELTDFEYLYENKYGIGGSATAMYLEILPEVKFSRKTLWNKCKANPVLARALAFLVRAHMSKLYIHKNRRDIFNPSDFGKMPYDVRVSIIYRMSIPYSGYNTEFYHNGYEEECINANINAITGDMKTGFDKYGYISPANFDVLDRVINNINSGYGVENMIRTCRNNGYHKVEGVSYIGGTGPSKYVLAKTK